MKKSYGSHSVGGMLLEGDGEHRSEGDNSAELDLESRQSLRRRDTNACCGEHDDCRVSEETVLILHRLYAFWQRRSG